MEFKSGTRYKIAKPLPGCESTLGRIVKLTEFHQGRQKGVSYAGWYSILERASDLRNTNLAYSISMDGTFWVAECELGALENVLDDFPMEEPK